MYESINPANGELLKRYPSMSRPEVEAVLDGTLAAQRQWAERSFAERGKAMGRAAELLRERAKELARLAAIEMGKPIAEGAAEAEKCAWVCEYYRDQAAEQLAPRQVKTDASRSFVRYDPLGVVLAVMPWNFPYWQVFRFFAPSLMAGNGGLLKHSSNVPQCAEAIETIARDAGFPPDLFRWLRVESREVAGIIEDPRVAAVTLTGSENAGRVVGAAAGKAIKPSVLELGGSDPFIVLADAEVDKAAETAAKARLINSGQSCIAAKRFIVVAPVYDRFVARFVEHMKLAKVGDPLDASVKVGPQARADLRDELHAQVERSVKAGARCALGGTKPPGPGAFYPVTVLADVPRDAAAACEETFGPVAAVIRAANEAEALDIANDTPFGLAASVWTQDPKAADRIAPRLTAGAVFFNGMVKSDPRLPFGGVKTSGYGRELSEEGIRAFVNVKSVWVA